MIQDKQTRINANDGTVVEKPKCYYYIRMGTQRIQKLQLCINALFSLLETYFVFCEAVFEVSDYIFRSRILDSVYFLPAVSCPMGRRAKWD